MTGGRSGGFACGAGKRRRRLGWPGCSAAVFVLRWDVPGQSRQPAQVPVIMLGTWYDNFRDGRGVPQPALHGGNRHASHRASALTWLPNGFPQATHIFVVQVVQVQLGRTFAWYSLLSGRGHPQLVHGGNEHVLHQVSVAALLLRGCPHWLQGFTAQTAQVQLGMTFAWYSLLSGRGHPQLVHGGNEHVLHQVSVAALLLRGCPHWLQGFTAQTAQVQLGMTFTWYCLLSGRGKPQPGHGGNAHVRHKVLVKLFLGRVALHSAHLPRQFWHLHSGIVFAWHVPFCGRGCPHLHGG